MLDCLEIKAQVDQMLKQDFDNITEHLCLANHSLPLQKKFIACLIELYTDQGYLQQSPFIDFFKADYDSELNVFLEKSKSVQPMYKIGHHT